MVEARPQGADGHESFVVRYRGACFVATILGVVAVFIAFGVLHLEISLAIVVALLLAGGIVGLGVLVGPRDQPSQQAAHDVPSRRTNASIGDGAAARRSDAADGIFISYRRQDEAAFAGRLYDRLARQFGTERVFIDVDSIHLGLDFTEIIDASLARCRILLVVIGARWVDARNERGQQRLANPHDFVRMEIETALARPAVRVIPVLVDDAPLPDLAELPASLSPLTRRQALAMANTSFGADADHLVRTLDHILQDGSGGPRKH